MKRGASLAAFVLLVGFLAAAQTQAPEDTSTATPRFHSQSRQIIVEAEVWDKSHKKGEPAWIGDEPLSSGEKDTLKGLPSPARGLTSKDFDVLDNGIKQTVNYLDEADFPAVDATNQWSFVPTALGTWGFLLTANWALEPPSATYLIGYVPPPSLPGECRTIRVLVQHHEVRTNRDRYCAPNSPDSNGNKTGQETKLINRMLRFEGSSAHSVIDVSMQASAFWSSGVLSLVNEVSTANPTPLSAGLRYVVEVHDSKAPATVHITAGFDLPTKRWDYPCRNDDALNVLVVAYRRNGEMAKQLSDVFKCGMGLSYSEEKWHASFMLAPSRFESQLSLLPGDYELAVVVTDGNYFGKARMPLHIGPLNPQSIEVSDVVVGGALRNASWILREAASVSPSPVVPTPLVSKSVQFFPDSDSPPRIRKHSPLFLYFEVYEPLSEGPRTAVYYHTRITDLKTGLSVMNTEPMSAADWMVPGSTVIPIGLKLATEKLGKGTYRLEVQASDSDGRQTEWRQAKFNIQ